MSLIREVKTIKHLSIQGNLFCLKLGCLLLTDVSIDFLLQKL
jgi:hypothetical protein